MSHTCLNGVLAECDDAMLLRCLLEASLFVGAAEVSLAICNSAPWILGLCFQCCPQATPTCSQRCSGHTDTWAADMEAQFAHFPLSPWVILPGNSAHMSHISFVCAPCASKLLLVSSYFPISWLWHTMFIHTFQPLPWQLESAYSVTCLTPWVEPAVERSAQRWRQVGELCNTNTTQQLFALFLLYKPTAQDCRL